MLVCEHRAGRSAITRNDVARYMPVYDTVGEAMAALSSDAPWRHRRRARANLPADLSSLRRSRDMVEEWLTAWSQTELIPAGKWLSPRSSRTCCNTPTASPRFGWKPTARRSRWRWKTAAANRPASTRTRWPRTAHPASKSWRHCPACGETLRHRRAKLSGRSSDRRIAFRPEYVRRRADERSLIHRPPSSPPPRARPPHADERVPHRRAGPRFPTIIYVVYRRGIVRDDPLRPGWRSAGPRCRPGCPPSARCPAQPVSPAVFGGTNPSRGGTRLGDRRWGCRALAYLFRLTQQWTRT